MQWSQQSRNAVSSRGELVGGQLNLESTEIFVPASTARARTDRIFINVIDGPGRGMTYEKCGADLTIGSAGDNDLAIADPTVSAHHARLSSAPHGIAVHDLGSRGGTFLGGMRIR